MAGPTAARVARGRRAPRLSLGLVAVAATASACSLGNLAFSAIRRQNIHTRSNLRTPEEIIVDKPEPVAAPKEPLPVYRVPYTMNLVSHFPNHKHLSEESATRRAIVDKITHSFENYDDLIKHIEVNLQFSENFHREMYGHGKAAIAEVDGDAEVAEHTGVRTLAPYVFKATVSLKNHRTIVMANPEKHAQPTLAEGLDHMVDVIRRSLREEKEKDIRARRKAMAEADMYAEGEEYEDDDVYGEPEEVKSAEEMELEQLVKAVEAQTQRE